jgi:hypothetical protein
LGLVVQSRLSVPARFAVRPQVLSFGTRVVDTTVRELAAAELASAALVPVIGNVVVVVVGSVDGITDSSARLTRARRPVPATGATA